jgi:hypothetical protein
MRNKQQHTTPIWQWLLIFSVAIAGAGAIGALIGLLAARLSN